MDKASKSYLPFKNGDLIPPRMILSWKWKLMLFAGTVIYGSYAILVNLCEVDGKIPFSSISMVLMIEVCKISLSLAMLIGSTSGGFKMPKLSSILPFSVPAVMYGINNNVAVHMQLQMDPTTYQILSNLKIATTAVLYRLIIKKHLTVLQWCSLGLLTVAGVLDSYGGYEVRKGKPSELQIHVTLKGLIMLITYCVISGLAGVYTEYILKRQYQMSLHLQNTMLYSFGILFNGGAWLVQALNSADTENRFNLFHGFSGYTWIIIITQVANGLIMSAVMKHASNITRLFIVSCAMLVTTVLSVLVFNTQISLGFMLSFSLVLVAMYLYHKNS